MILERVMRRLRHRRIMNDMKGNQQANECWCDYAKYGDSLRGRNSNVLRRQRSKWPFLEF
jgi:hypothetical protein